VLAIQVQSDGKIVVLGRDYGAASGTDVLLARFEADGRLDTTFGDGGVTRVDVEGADDYPAALAIQADGKLLVADDFYSRADMPISIMRFTTDGRLDMSFAKRGRAAVGFPGGVGQISAMVVQPNGRILAVGSVSPPAPATPATALVRLTRDGKRDKSFGRGGRVVTDFSDEIGEGAFDVALQPDGRIVIVGAVPSPGRDYDFFVARYLKNGRLDESFGDGGSVLTDFSGDRDYAVRVALLADGKILAAGYITDSASHSEFAVARYDANGGLDESFGEGGKKILDFGDSSGVVGAVGVQADGAIVLVGSVYDPRGSTGVDFSVARLLSDGTPDETFGEGGIAVTDFEGGNDQAFTGVLQPDGKILAAGFAVISPSEPGYLALARYWGAR
jgi:uncharacterized delta-60 repeat protein